MSRTALKELQSIGGARSPTLRLAVEGGPGQRSKGAGGAWRKGDLGMKITIRDWAKTGADVLPHPLALAAIVALRG